MTRIRRISSVVFICHPLRTEGKQNKDMNYALGVMGTVLDIIPAVGIDYPLGP